MLVAPADAAVVRVDGSTVRFEAAPAEANDVGFEYTSDLTLIDRGATLTPGPGCRPGYGEAGRRVTCAGAFDGVVVDLGDENDAFDPSGYGWGKPLAVKGGDGADLLRGQYSAVVDGGGGDDHLSDGGTLRGGDGADFIENAQTAEGGPGNDVLRGSYGVRLSGGPGDDDLGSANGYFDGVMAGDEGNDRIVAGYARADGGPGSDVIDAKEEAAGGDGDDRITLSRNESHVAGYEPVGYGIVNYVRSPAETCKGSSVPRFTEDTMGRLGPIADAGAGNDEVFGTGNHEWLVGGPGDDRLIGGGGGDALDGEAGADELDGGDGGDLLLGGEGDDGLDGGAASDRLSPGPGTDTAAGGPGDTDEICYDGATVGIHIDLSSPGGDGPAGENDSIAGDVEHIGGTPFDDVLVAGSGAVQMRGGDGDDRLTGGPASDAIEGGFGSDSIAGGDGGDRLSGGREYRHEQGRSVASAGNDVIEGGPGNDQLRGERGDDYLSGGPGGDSILAGESASSPSPFAAVRSLNHSPVISLVHEDQIWCGSGRDVVQAGYPDGIGSDCEFTLEGTPRWRRVSLGRRGSASFKVRCAWRMSSPCQGAGRLLPVSARRPMASGALPDQEPPAWCKPLPRPEKALGRVGFRLRAGRVGTVQVPLTRRGRAVVARRGCVAVRVALEMSARDGVRFGATRTLVLTRRGFKPPPTATAGP